MRDIIKPDHPSHGYYLRVAKVAEQLGLSNPRPWLVDGGPSASIGWDGNNFRLIVNVSEGKLPEQGNVGGIIGDVDPHYSNGYRQGYFNKTMRDAGIPETVLSRSQLEKATDKINKALAAIEKELGLRPVAVSLYIPPEKYRDETKPSILIKFQVEIATEADSVLGLQRTHNVGLVWQLPSEKPAA